MLGTRSWDIHKQIGIKTESARSFIQDHFQTIWPPPCLLRMFAFPQPCQCHPHTCWLSLAHQHLDTQGYSYLCAPRLQGSISFYSALGHMNPSLHSSLSAPPMKSCPSQPLDAHTHLHTQIPTSLKNSPFHK